MYSRLPHKAACLKLMQIEDDPSRERYSREAISLLMVHRKPQRSEDLLGDTSGR